MSFELAKAQIRRHSSLQFCRRTLAVFSLDLALKLKRRDMTQYEDQRN